MADLGSDKHYAHAVTISIEALKSLLLINGGAATALIALKTKNGADFVLPVLLFGLAALLSAVTLVLGYFSQLAYANTRFEEERGNADAARKLIMQHGVWQTVAITLIILSLLASAGGMTSAFLQVEVPGSPAQPQPSCGPSKNAQAIPELPTMSTLTH